MFFNRTALKFKAKLQKKSKYGFKKINCWRRYPVLIFQKKTLLLTPNISSFGLFKCLDLETECAKQKKLFLTILTSYSQVPNKLVGWKKCEQGGISNYFFLSLRLFFSACFPTCTFSTLLVYLAPKSSNTFSRFPALGEQNCFIL